MDHRYLFVFNIFAVSVANDITLTKPSGNATVGEDFTLTCTTDINVPIFEQNLEDFICTVVKSSCTCDGADSAGYSLSSCLSNVYILNISSSKINTLHGSTWRCIDASGPGKSEPITLFVNDPIQHVNLTTEPDDTEPVIIFEGEKRNLTCRTNPARPTSLIRWFNSSVDITNQSEALPDEPAQNEKIISSSILEVKGLMQNDNVTIHCTASNTKSKVKSLSKTINIWYRPSSVVLSPSISSYTVTEATGSIGPITCTADCRHNCTMTWSGPNLPAGTTSVLNLQKISRSQAGEYKCKATNIVGSTISATVTVDINYPPNDVFLSTSTLNYTVTEHDGSVGPITCTADCRPNCTMIWSGPNVPGGTTSVLNLQNINRNQAGYYICNASNSINSSMSAKVTVIVNYGPSSVVLSPLTSWYTVNETTGSVGPITCIADCKPSCKMNWSGPNLPGGTTSALNLYNITRIQTGNYSCNASNTINHLMSAMITVIVNHGPYNVVFFPSTSSYTVNETTGSVGPINCTSDCRPNCIMTWSGPNLPGSSTSVLNLENINRKQSGGYTCNAKNIFGSLISIKLTVIVNYGPDDIIINPSKLSYTVNETTDSVGPITCTADCRPNCTMTWSGPYIADSTTSVLNLQNISRNMAGDYICSANNNYGSPTSLIVTVVVNYIPTIIGFDGNTTYYENDTAEFRCKVESSPKSSIQWKFMDGINTIISLIENNHLFEVNGSLLRVSRMDCLSMGTYICEARNLIGKTHKGLNVTVMCAPRLNTFEYEVQDRIAVKDNESLNITAPVLAYPTPWIYWQFIQNGSVTNISYTIVETRLSNRQFSILIIKKITMNELGTYVLYGGNGIKSNDGNYIGTYEVQAARRPIKPSNITCLAGHDYILVSWQPEFNGGSPQSFRVFYKRKNEEMFKPHQDNVSEANYHPVKIGNLPSFNVYFLYVQAENIYNTTVSDEVQCNTTAKELITSDSFIAVGVGAGVGSAVVVISIVIIALFIFRQLRTKSSKNDTEPMKRSNAEEDELEDNPLYVSTADEALHQNGNYSQVSKKLERGKKTKQIEMGFVYENNDDFLKGNDQIYANQLDTGKDPKEYNKNKNKDGLIYADLDLAPVSEERKFVIRGLESRNNYAIIDLSKKADPLPFDDDDEEKKSEDNGK